MSGNEDPDVALLRALKIQYYQPPYVGNVITLILFGIQVFMCFSVVSAFLSSPPSIRKTRRLYLAISVLTLFLSLIVVTENVVYLQLALINYRQLGPPAFAFNDNSWWVIFGTSAAAVNNHVGIGVLLYRCYIIYQSWWVMAFPFLIYLSSIATALTQIITRNLPDWTDIGNPFLGPSIFTPDRLTVTWYSLSVAANSLLTALIIIRLLRARKDFTRVFKADDSGLKMYTGISAMLIESALPFSLLGIVATIMFAYSGRVPAGRVFIMVWVSFYALSPQFIIFRVTTGKGWTKELATRGTGTATTLPFESQRQPATARMETEDEETSHPAEEVNVEFPQAEALGSDPRLWGPRELQPLRRTWE